MNNKGLFFLVLVLLGQDALLSEEEHHSPAGFVLVEAGTFTMGSDPSTSGRDSDEIRQRVRISNDFYMSTYEVTQAEFRSIMGLNPSKFKGDNLPAENMSWYDAIEYCNRKSRGEGLTPCYTTAGGMISCDFSANGYRLPTEAEWEYAAAGGKNGRNYRFSGGNELDAVGWYAANSGNRTNPVGKKQANELGLFDMSGNVSEWCWDWYAPYPGGSVTDPRGPFFGWRRTERGGGWYAGARFCRSANRNMSVPESTSAGLGIRLVRSGLSCKRIPNGRERTARK